MKTLIIVFLVFFSSTVVSQDEKNRDAILGTWLTGEGNGIVEIYKNGDKYQGKVVWLKEPNDPKTGKPKTDIRHPDKSQHERPIKGLVNLWGFSFNGKDKWENGHIYDPKNGKEYKSVITVKDVNTIEVRGFVGITLIGRTDVWKRKVVPGD